MKKLILGCGYLGSRVATAWLTQGEEVLAVTRSPQRAEEFRSRGIKPIVGDVTESLDLRDGDEIDTLLFAVGFDRTAGHSMQAVYVDGLRSVLEQLPAWPRRFIYISSTGVYAQEHGEWIDESAPCLPRREGGQACLAAEELLREHVIGERTITLRLAGIYGPGRLPKLADLLAGRPLAVSAHGFLNLIHVDDAVRVVLAAEAKLAPPELLLVSDGHPVLRGEFYRELARLSQAPEPIFSTSEIDASTAPRALTDKRIDNRRLIQHLGGILHYPTYREGLQSLMRDQIRD